MHMKMAILRGLFVVSLALIFLGAIFFSQQARFNDGKLHVVFCDVGQGDAIFIRTPKGADLLIDQGPNDSVLSCLSNHMPFWDRTIELAILTHPHADHFSGLFSILPRYNVLSFATENLSNKSEGFSRLRGEIDSRKIPLRYLYAGDSVKIGEGTRLEILAPSTDFLQRTSPGGEIGESGEFASLITLLRFGETSFLLTGDSQAAQLDEAIREASSAPNGAGVGVLQVPHHGSKTGLTADIVDRISPRLAVISVGKNNRYGHPSNEVIEILRKARYLSAGRQVKILRTDEIGEVEIISDGNKWQVRTRRK